MSPLRPRRRPGPRPAGATTVATSRNTTPKYCAERLPRTPNFSSVSLSDPGVEVVVTLAIVPNITPNPSKPAHHATSTGNSRLALSPNAEPRPNARSGATSSEARMPSPVSRFDESTTATLHNPITARTAGISGRRSFRVSGCIRSIQPNGVAHSNHRVAWPASPIMRNTRVTPNVATARPVAPRRVRLSCEATAPTPTNTAGAIDEAQPEEQRTTHAETDLGVAAGEQREERRSRRRSRRPPRTVAVTVAAVARAGRVLPASTSWRRPPSSSPRSIRVAASNAQMAPMVVRNTKTL